MSSYQSQPEQSAGEPRAIVFAVLILVLLIKPTGILGKPIHEKV